MDRVILHVDMDAFYAAVEARDDPCLRGRPLVVGADPRGGAGRGVVCTASYEARAFGLRSAMPISQAWRLAPHATYIRPDFRRYGAASRAVMEVLRRYADVLDEGASAPSAPAGMGAVPEGRRALEVAGMDEAYLDVTERVRGADGEPDWGLALSLARSLQAAVKRETRLSCSVGVAPNKSVAKVASDRRKPHGIVRVRPHEVEAFLAPLPPGKLNGCGPKTAAALRDLGVLTIAELARLPESSLVAAFGSHGSWLHGVANGRDDRQVRADRGERKSRGNETTFPRDATSTEKVLEVAEGLLDELLADQAERDGRAYSTLTVKLRYHDFTTLTRANTASLPYEAGSQASGSRAKAAVAALLRPLLDGRPVRLVGVRLSGFQEATGQRSLDLGLAPATVRLHATRLPAGAFDPGGLRWTRLEAWMAA